MENFASTEKTMEEKIYAFSEDLNVLGFEYSVSLKKVAVTMKRL